MAEIEWHETSELRPAAGSLADCCSQLGVRMAGDPGPGKIMAMISQRALEGLYDFLAGDLQREHGGVLVGQPFFDAEKERCFVVIYAAVPAFETEGSAVHLQFTPETWAYISGIMQDEYPNYVILGWYHSHPGLGVFMSSTDQATQQAFYYHPWSLAVVVDPVAQKTGWFSGVNCVPMDRSQVIPFGEQRQPAWPGRPLSPFEQQYLAQQTRRGYGWLLPFGMLLVGLAALAWWLGKGRLAAGLG